MIKDIKGFEGRYSIGDDGYVYSHIKNRKLNGTKMKNGYIGIILNKDGNYYCRYVHRLVAEAFIPNEENKPEVDHINGDRSDNRLCNLRWATKKENRRNPITTERMSKAKIGKPSARRKPVYQIKDGVILKRYGSLQDAADATGTRRSDISSVITGKQKTANGYVWRVAV